MTTGGHTLLPIAYICEPGSPGELRGHHEVEVVFAQGRGDKREVAIDTLQNIVHIDGCIDACEHGRDGTVLDHQLMELLTINVEEEAEHIVL